jgi:hypothetical protein
VSGLGKLFVSGKYEERDWPEAEKPDDKIWVADQEKLFEKRSNNNDNTRLRRDTKILLQL